MKISPRLLLLLSILLALVVVCGAEAVSSPPSKRIGVSPHPASREQMRLPSRALDELYASTDVPKTIPDGPMGTPALSTLQIPAALNVEDLNVSVTITHTWVRDLRISLIAPDQTTEVVLLDLLPFDNVVNMTDVLFNDESSRTAAELDTPFTGSYRPQQPLSAFDGLSAQGTWTLRVQDRFYADTGSVVAWSIDLNPPVSLIGSVVDSATREPIAQATVAVPGSSAGAQTDSAGNYTIEGLAPGNYDFLFAARFYDTLVVPGVVIESGIVRRLDAAMSMNVRTLVFDAEALPDTMSDSVGTGADNIIDRDTVTIHVANATTLIDIDVTVRIRHPWVSDLDLFLRSPGGVSIPLVQINHNPCPGDDIDDYWNTRFDDDAQTAIGDGVAPFTGSFRPSSPLQPLVGTGTLGDWKLIVVDYCDLDVAIIEGFTLHMRVDGPVAADNPRPDLPREFAFHGGYPNPFNSRTQFRFDLARPQRVELALYNTLGQEVARVTDAVFEAGTHTIHFDAAGLASGLYFARLSAFGTAQTRKMILLK